MGREVRKVPANWEHPKNEAGYHIALHDGQSLARRTNEWDQGKAMWALGLRQNWSTKEYEPTEEKYVGETWEEWDGERPDPAEYMPAWHPSVCTHLMMYEDTSEGTPISPVFATPEELAKWCADNGASAFGSSTASYEAWLRIARGGFAPSMIIENGVMKSGVAALARDPV